MILASVGLTQEWFAWEGKVYHSIHDDMKCQFLDYLSGGLKFMADVRTSFFVPLALYTFGNEKEYMTAKLGTAGLALSAVTVFGLKTAINRQRPVGEYPRWDSSIPSGHTTFAFSTSIIYSHSYPKLIIPLLLYSSMVGLSRIYDGEHYPTDVLAGMALGTGVGLVVIKFKKEILSFP